MNTYMLFLGLICICLADDRFCWHAQEQCHLSKVKYILFLRCMIEKGNFSKAQYGKGAYSNNLAQRVCIGCKS